MQINDMIPTSVTDFGEKMNDQFAEQMKTASKSYTETNDRVLDAIVETNRKAVDFAVKTADSVSDRAPEVELPFADRLDMPTPAEAGKRYIDMVERLVELNRDFNERVVDMLPAVKSAAKKPAAKKPAAKKAAAKKATARKAAKKAPTRKAAAKK